MSGRQKMVRLSAGLMSDEANRIAERLADEADNRKSSGRWAENDTPRSGITLPKLRFMRDYEGRVPGA